MNIVKPMNELFYNNVLDFKHKVKLFIKWNLLNDIRKCLLLNKTLNDYIDVENRININDTFIACCYQGHLEIAKDLYHIIDKTQQSPTIYNTSCKGFIQACHNNNQNIAEWLFLECSLFIPSSITNECINATFSKGNLNLTKWLYNLSSQIIINSNSLIIACRRGHKNVIEWLYNIKPNMDIWNNSCHMQTSFWSSCQHGHIELCKLLLKINQYITINDKHSFNYAVNSGNIELTSWLLNIKPEINISANNEENFRDACENGHLKMAKWLFETKPFINISAINNTDTYDTFSLCCMEGHFETAKWLFNLNINIGKDIDHIITDYQDNIHDIFSEICKKGNLELAQWFITINPRINFNKNISYTFSETCAKGNLELAKWLLTLTSEIDISISDDFAFRSACDNQDIIMAKWLYSIKPTINVRACDEYAFRASCYHTNFEFIYWLYSINPSINIRANNDEAFKYTCETVYTKYDYDKIEIVNWFISKCPSRYSVTIEKGKIIDYEISHKLYYELEEIDKNSLSTTDNLCCICSINEINVQTNCKHNYCSECLTEWTNRKPTCPYCREELTRYYKIVNQS